MAFCMWFVSTDITASYPLRGYWHIFVSLCGFSYCSVFFLFFLWFFMCFLLVLIGCHFHVMFACSKAKPQPDCRVRRSLRIAIAVLLPRQWFLQKLCTLVPGCYALFLSNFSQDVKVGFPVFSYESDHMWSDRTENRICTYNFQLNESP